MSDNERNIVRRAQGGDAQAFSLLVETYQGPVYRLLLKMGLSPADAEETAQEAFIDAWRGLPKFRGESKFSTWLYALAAHAAIDFLRREKRRAPTMDIEECLDVTNGADQPEQEAEKKSDREAVAMAMAELSPEYREVLLLRYGQELDYGEIAAALHLPAGTVKSRISRAKAQLKEKLLAQGNFFSGDAVLSVRGEDESHEK